MGGCPYSFAMIDMCNCFLSGSHRAQHVSHTAQNATPSTNDPWASPAHQPDPQPPADPWSSPSMSSPGQQSM